jgi:hypothetical protein
VDTRQLLLLIISVSVHCNKSVNVLGACSDYLDIDALCAKAVVNSSLRTSLLNIENAVIDAITSGLTDRAVYLVTFRINER